MSEITTAGRWIEAGLRLLEYIESTQMEAIAAAATISADAIAAGGFVHGGQIFQPAEPDLRRLL